MAIPVVLMGLGEIGKAVARAALAEPDLRIVAALDLHPDRVGRPLADLVGIPAPDVIVTNVADDAFRAAQGGLLLHATGSRLAKVVPELESALRAGLSVVSTCEELAFPWVSDPEVADRLDRLAQKKGVAIIGLGVNPGFVLDRLLATLGQVSGRVERVEGLRVVDASRRREALQRKIGAGMSESDFQRAVEEGHVGHVGLLESAALAAMGVGHGVDHVEEDISPVFADAPQRALWGMIQPGETCGVRQIARAFDEGREVARLELVIALGAQDPRDELRVFGDPPIHMRIPGGIPGDSATAWTVAHAAATIGQRAEPGLMTVLDLPAGR